MKRWLLVAAALLPALSSAKGPTVTSAYTKLDLGRCKEMGHGEEWVSWRCPGYRGIPLFVQNGDERYDVDAGSEDVADLFAAKFDYPGSTVEWRLSRGKPFAIIYRLASASRDEPKSCRIASIDGSLPDANALARRAADGALRGPVHCLTGR